MLSGIRLVNHISDPKILGRRLFHVGGNRILCNVRPVLPDDTVFEFQFILIISFRNLVYRIQVVAQIEERPPPTHAMKPVHKSVLFTDQ